MSRMVSLRSEGLQTQGLSPNLPRCPLPFPATSLLPFCSSSATRQRSNLRQVRAGPHPCTSPPLSPAAASAALSPGLSPGCDTAWHLSMQGSAGRTPQPGAQHGIQRALGPHQPDRLQVGTLMGAGSSSHGTHSHNNQTLHLPYIHPTCTLYPTLHPPYTQLYIQPHIHPTHNPTSILYLTLI